MARAALPALAVAPRPVGGAPAQTAGAAELEALPTAADGEGAVRATWIAIVPPGAAEAVPLLGAGVAHLGAPLAGVRRPRPRQSVRRAVAVALADGRCREPCVLPTIFTVGGPHQLHWRGPPAAVHFLALALIATNAS